MSRWWRAYDEAVDDPKLQQLRPELFKAWFNICCITSQNDGTLPAIATVAFKLRVRPEKARAIVAELTAAGLIDDDGNGNLAPHNWSKRQFPIRRFNRQGETFQGTVSKRFIDRFCNAARCRDRADTEAEERPRPSRSARDIRADLFGKGLKTLAAITGKTPIPADRWSGSG